MNREDAKQWVRNQIDSSLKKQAKYNKNMVYLYYNKNYVRALKLSKITGKPVNNENFNGGDEILLFNTSTNSFWFYSKFLDYLKEQYSKDYLKRRKIVEEVVKEYDEYKNYKYFNYD